MTMKSDISCYEWDLRPRNLRTKTEINRAGFKLNPEQKAKAFVHSMDEKRLLFDLYECVPKPRTNWDYEEGIKRIEAAFYAKRKGDDERDIYLKAEQLIYILEGLIETIERNPDYYREGLVAWERYAKKYCADFKRESREVRSRLQSYQKKYLPQPQPSDVVMGGITQKGPRPDDAVLGGNPPAVH